MNIFNSLGFKRSYDSNYMYASRSNSVTNENLSLKKRGTTTDMFF